MNPVPNSDRLRLDLVRGGLIYRVERWLGLIDAENLGIAKRIRVFLCLTWLPIVLIALIRSATHHHDNTHAALYSDFKIHARYLIAAPLLIASEFVIDLRLNRSIGQLHKSGVVESPLDLDQIVERANQRIGGKTGLWMEAAIAISIILFAALGNDSWTAIDWNRWIALPLFHLLQLRWLWRFAVWIELLWALSRLKLNLSSAHPDLAGGLGVLAFAQKSFAVICLALSAGASGTLAYRVLTEGKSLEEYYPIVIAFVGIEVALLLAPLAFFIRQLASARREGYLHYGVLSSHYVQMFDRKWITAKPVETGEPLLGSSDIQSLADLGNSFERVRKMRLFPAERKTVVAIVFAGVFPFLPLALLVVRVEVIFHAAIKMFL